MATKILIIGKTGNLGSAVVSELSKTKYLENSWQLITPAQSELDLLKPETDILKQLEAIAPDIIVNCAAYTAVDDAEDNPEICTQLNRTAVKTLARYANTHNKYLIHFSTDYVFDGQAREPYKTNSLRNPKGVYASSKLLGEQTVLETASNNSCILRVSWLFGDAPTGFIAFIINQAQQGKPIKAVTDQIGSPTYTHSVAQLLPSIIAKKPTGIFHANNSGEPVSRYAQAQFVLQKMGFSESEINTVLIPAVTSEFFTKAPRPLYSAMDCSFKDQLPNWQDATCTYLRHKGLLKDTMLNVC